MSHQPTPLMYRYTLWLGLILSIALAAAGCGVATSTPGSMTEVPCRFTLPAGQVDAKSVICSDLTVPASRGDADGTSFTVHVARFVGRGGADTVPTIHLPGGPAPAQNVIDGLTTDRLARLIDLGDLVIFDYRGEGTSRPRLACREKDVIDPCIAPDPEDRPSLEFFDSQAIADDVSFLVKALGYAKVNLIGTSYGTRIALEIMRRHPGIVHAVVLDSPLPPQAPVFAAPMLFQGALQEFFAACADDAVCNSAYPELEAVFVQTVVDIFESPLTLSNGTVIGAADVLEALLATLYYRNYYSQIPSAITMFAERNIAALDILWPEVAQFVDIFKSNVGLLGRVVHCNDNLQHFSDEDVEPYVQQMMPEFQDFSRDRMLQTLHICDDMILKAADPVDVTPVAATLPTLILVGQMDPVTPPEYGRVVSENLSRSTVIEAPLTGHWVHGEDCGFNLMLHFLLDPTAKLDQNCLDDLATIDFVTEIEAP